MPPPRRRGRLNASTRFSASLDDRGMARIFIGVQGRQNSASYRALVDTGSTFVVIPENDCINLGLTHTGRKANLRTGGGIVSAAVKLFGLRSRKFKNVTGAVKSAIHD
jgi:predicted aspartyl protease